MKKKFFIILFSILFGSNLTYADVVVVKANLRYSTSCRYRDWNRAKGGFHIWAVEDNIAAR